MTRAPVLPLALAVVLSWTGPVQALEVPKGGPADPRIKIVDYDPWQVVKITGQFRAATQILFGTDETILHVALGDTSGWDVAAEGAILFVKPKAPHGPTNLIVTTRRPGGTRNYTFELTARTGAADRGAVGAVYGLRFRYPQDERAQALAAVSAEELRLRQAVVQLKLDRAVIEGRRNLAYAVQGAASLQPSEVTDNGRFTVLRFPGAAPIPAIYLVEDGGTERLASFDVRGEFVVVHAVARALRLRRGHEVLCVYNQAFTPYGAASGTGTAAPDVTRTDKVTP